MRVAADRGSDPGNGLLDRVYLQLAPENLPDLLRREAVWPLRSWLKLAKALQEEIAARLE